MGVLMVVAKPGWDGEYHRLTLRGLLQHLGRHFCGVSAVRQDVRDIQATIGLSQFLHLRGKEIIRDQSLAIRLEQLLHLKIFGRYMWVPPFYGVDCP